MTKATKTGNPKTACARCGTPIPDRAATCPHCGLNQRATTGVYDVAAAQPDDAAVVRAALADEYDILEELGRGGMAIVFRARERALERDVAIKVLPRTLTFDAALVERFQREARIAAALEHPHIVPIHRVGRAGDTIFFVMKHVKDGSLADRLRDRHHLPAEEVHKILVEVGGALAYAAERGVVHRDIKPENILFDESGRAMVTDFGIARSADATQMTRAGTSVGTPRYMSPEQARGKELDGRSDIYSLGVVAYECLTGRAPFEGSDHYSLMYAHVSQPIPAPALDTAEERTVFGVIERMLRKDPVDRPQSGAELEALLEGRSPNTPKPRARRAARVPIWQLATAGALIIALGAAALFSNRSEATPTKTAKAAPPKEPFSRCPRSTEVRPTVPYRVMVDPVGVRKRGADIKVAYDVCGLKRGAAYEGVIVAKRQQSKVGRLFGGTDPVEIRFTEEVISARSRQERTLATRKLPAGTYTLTVSVRDTKDRVRSVATTFEIAREK
ncbi:MAG: protein kinase domain-containing protein [Gemmatimonadaceae bacterium]